MAQATSKKAKETFFTGTFSSFSADDLDAAREFYGETLGIDVSETKEGGLELSFPDSGSVFIYPKDDHEAASFTVLNFSVDDIEAAVEDLSARGIEFESYGGDIETDDMNIFRGKEKGHGPNIAWFKDPAGNVLSVIEN